MSVLITGFQTRVLRSARSVRTVCECMFRVLEQLYYELCVFLVMHGPLWQFYIPFPLQRALNIQSRKCILDGVSVVFVAGTAVYGAILSFSS